MWPKQSGTHQKAGMENSLVDPGMSSNEISVVLAVYNGEKYLAKLLESLFAQKGVTIKELIVVDDKSTDGSMDIVNAYQQTYPQVKIVGNEVNLGPIGSFKKGAALCTSDYLAFADQDDIWKENKLARSLSCLKQVDIDNKPSMVFTDLEMMDEEGNPLNGSFWKWYDIDPAKNNFYTILFGNIATGCTMVINKKMRDELVAMPLNAPMHDHWMALIAFSIGNYGYLDDQTVLYRLHNSSVTNKNEVTFSQKVGNFLEASFSKESDFMGEYINQAVLFKSKYGDKLNAQTNRQLDYFIKLKSSSGFMKKIKRKLRFSQKKWD